MATYESSSNDSQNETQLSSPKDEHNQDNYVDDNQEHSRSHSRYDDGCLHQQASDMNNSSDSKSSPQPNNESNTGHNAVVKEVERELKKEEDSERKEKSDQDSCDVHDSFTKTSDDLDNDDVTFIQVNNISPNASIEQIQTLFGFLGDIEQIELYPNENAMPETNSKVAFIKYSRPWSVMIAQHLTNTVFIDRTLIVFPFKKSKIPDKETALLELKNNNALSNNFNAVNQVVSRFPQAIGAPMNAPSLSISSLAQVHSHIPASSDSSRAEEIRRTIYVGNIDATFISTPEQLLKFFNDIGEVKYIRLAGDESKPTRYAFVEFTHQSSVVDALKYNGQILGSRALKIEPSNNAIVKPQAKADKQLEDIDKKEHHRDRNRDLSHERNHSSRYDRDRRNLDRRRDERISRSRRSRTPESYSRHSRSRSRSRERRRRSRSRDYARRRSSSRDIRRRSRESRRRKDRPRSRTPPPKRKKRRRRR